MACVSMGKNDSHRLNLRGFSSLTADLYSLRELQELDTLPGHRMTEFLQLGRKRRKRSRLDHSIQTGWLAYHLGQIFGGDLRLCARGGLLHDIGATKKGCWLCHHDPMARYNCGFCHHKTGAQFVAKLGEEKKLANVVKSHMFPLFATLPRSKEALLVGFADKIDAFMAFFGLDRPINRAVTRKIRRKWRL